MIEASSNSPKGIITVNGNFQALRYSHGHARRGKWTPEFRAWHGMKCRCTYPTMKGYENYGGRGIRFCERWLVFSSFLDDLGLKPSPNLSLDRIDTDLHYSCGKCKECKRNGWPMNCRWATKLEQDNNRRTNVKFTFGNQTRTISEWARVLNVTAASMGKRIYEWGIDRALTEPKRTIPLISFNGESLTLGQWAKRAGITSACLFQRIKAGWAMDRALISLKNTRLPAKPL